MDGNQDHSLHLGQCLQQTAPLSFSHLSFRFEPEHSTLTFYKCACAFLTSGPSLCFFSRSGAINIPAPAKYATAVQFSTTGAPGQTTGGPGPLGVTPPPPPPPPCNDSVIGALAAIPELSLTAAYVNAAGQWDGPWCTSMSTCIQLFPHYCSLIKGFRLIASLCIFLQGWVPCWAMPLRR